MFSHCKNVNFPLVFALLGPRTVQVCIVRGKDGVSIIDPLASDNAKLHCLRVKAVLGRFWDHLRTIFRPLWHLDRCKVASFEGAVWQGGSMTRGQFGKEAV